MVYTVDEDRKGNIWIATSWGLYYFNGKSFSLAGPLETETTDLLCVQDKVWMATSKGLFIYDKGEIKQVTDSTLASLRVGSLLLLKNGTVLVGTNKGIVSYKNGAFRTFWTWDDPEYIMDMEESADGSIWFCTLEGSTYRYQKEGRLIWFDNSHNMIPRKIIVSNNGDVLVAHDKDFMVFKNGQYTEEFLGQKDKIEPGIITAMQDHENNFWVATVNGLVAIRPTNVKKFIPSEKTITGIRQFNSDSSLYVFSDDKIYAIDNDTLSEVFRFPTRFSGSLSFAEKIGPKDYLLGTSLGGIIEYRNGNYNVYAEEFLPINYATAPDRKQLLIAARNKMMVYEDGELSVTETKGNGELAIVPTCMITSKDGILLGTSSGVYRYDNGEYTNLPLSIPEKQLYINDIYDCKDGTYLLATKSYGLHRVNIKDDVCEVVSTLTTKNGLGTNSIKKILVDGNTVWITAINGVYKISDYFTKPYIVYLNAEDGLLNNSWNFSSLLMDRKGYIYIGGSAGLVRFHKDESFHSSIVQKTYITSITVNNEENYKWDTPDSLILFMGIPARYTFAPNQTSLTFHFTGLNLSHPIRVKYEYVLEGYSKTPVVTGADYASFNSLAPGNYIFKVRSTTNQLFTNEKYAVFPFTIQAPFWQTWWFRIMVSAMLVYLAYAFYQWRLSEQIKKQKAQIKVEKQLSESKILAFQARMNPHFIFNSLNAIQYFMLNNDKLATLNYLSKFARLLRQILDNSIDPKINLEKEIEMLRSYLEMEELRFDNRFSYQIKIAEDLDQTTTDIPGMIIQPFVENAIIHGLLHREEDGGLLKIDFQTNGKQVICIVEDNGVGRQKSAELNARKYTNHRSHGTSIAINRLQLLNDKEQGIINQVTFIDLEENHKPAGVRVIIQIPIL